MLITGNSLLQRACLARFPLLPPPLQHLRAALWLGRTSHWRVRKPRQHRWRGACSTRSCMWWHRTRLLAKRQLIMPTCALACQRMTQEICIQAPDDAVLHQRLEGRGSLDQDGLSETSHVHIDILQDAVAADSEGRAVSALVHARFTQSTLPLDEQPLGDVDALAALPEHQRSQTLSAVTYPPETQASGLPGRALEDVGSIEHQECSRQELCRVSSW